MIKTNAQSMMRVKRREPDQEIVWNGKDIWTVLKDQEELPRWLGTVQEKDYMRKACPTCLKWRQGMELQQETRPERPHR